MEYHSGGSLPLLGRPRYCPGANANGGYLCETGHCCGETGCCTYYYELWWFWLLWTVLILFSCCCAYRHRRAKQRVQQQQRQREISLLAYHGASYTSSMLDLSFLASLKLPSYEEVAAQPSTPPPPYSAVFTAPRYPQPPRTADPHLLTQHGSALAQHGPLLHQPLSDGPSSLSSDNSSSCSCDSCCPSSPCSSSLSAAVTYETDTSHASTPSEVTPLALDTTETINTAAGRLELHQARLSPASVAIDIERPLAMESSKLNVVAVAVVTRSTSPLDTMSPNSKMATVDTKVSSDVGTLLQPLPQKPEHEAPTSNPSEHLEAPGSKLDAVTIVTTSMSPMDLMSPNSDTPTILAVEVKAATKQQLDLKSMIQCPVSPLSPQSNTNAVLSCVQSMSTSPTTSPQDTLQRTCVTASSPPSPKTPRASRTLIQDSTGNTCQDKNISLIPIIAPSNLKTAFSKSVEEESLSCNSLPRTSPDQKQNTDMDLTFPGEQASAITISVQLQNTVPSIIQSSPTECQHSSNLLTSLSQGTQNFINNPHEETESPEAVITKQGIEATSPDVFVESLKPKAANVTTTENPTREVVPSSLLPLLTTEPSTSTPEALTLLENANFIPPQKDLQLQSKQASRSSPNSPNESPKSAHFDLTSNLEMVLHSPTVPKKQELTPTPPGQILDLPTPQEFKGALLSCLELSPTQSELSCLVIPTSHGQEKADNHSTTTSDSTSTANLDVLEKMAMLVSRKPEHYVTVDLSCPNSNSSEHLEATNLLKPYNPSLVDSSSSLGLPRSPSLTLEHPFTQLPSENVPSGSDVSSFCPSITIHADPPSFATSPSSPCSIPSPPVSMLLLDPLAALNPSEKSGASSGHASSLSPSPRNTQSPPKQTLFSPCVDVFEPVNPNWEEDEDENEDDDYDDDDMGVDESQYRHRRLTGDSGIEVCRCRVEDEDEDEKLQKDNNCDQDGIVEKKLAVSPELHDSVDCPVRSQKSTADERTLCNAASDTSPTSEDAGKVVIPVETV